MYVHISLNKLLKSLNFKKTALSNHLIQLIKSELVEKRNYGVYQITQDGKKYLRNLYQTWHSTLKARQKKLAQLESRQNSTAFMNAYIHKTE